MKKLSIKITAVLAAVILLTAALAPTAFALGGFDMGSFSELLGDLGDFGSITDIIGGILSGNNGEGNGISLGDLVLNPNGIMDILQERLANLGVEASRGEIINAIYALIGDTNPGDITSMLTSNDFLNRLAEYLQATQTTEPLTEATTRPTPTEESTTAAPTTEIPSYEIPSVIIPSSYVYQGADAYSTQPAATTTEPVYSYVQPSTQYTEPATTVPFAANYTESTANTASNNTAKLMIGAVVVLASAAAVVVVAMMLKKTKV